MRYIDVTRSQAVARIADRTASQQKDHHWLLTAEYLEITVIIAK